MEYIEKNQRKAYIKKDDYSMSGLNLRLKYMVEDYDKLINEELNKRQFFTKHRIEGQLL